MTCKSVQTLSQFTPAAVKLAATFDDARKHGTYSPSDIVEWNIDKYTYITIPKAVADLLDIWRHHEGTLIAHRLYELVMKVNDLHVKQMCHIMKTEHDRIISDYDTKVSEIIENFEEMFMHDFDGKYLDDIEFQEEIKQEYLDEVAFDLIVEYETLLEAHKCYSFMLSQRIYN